ncbi:MAG TPA: hypothetical protein VFA38_08130 [Nitrospirales bacterium]|nr:hypothetical protein [Nitrospirales bacterium]
MRRSPKRPPKQTPVSTLSQAEIVEAVRRTGNPYELLALADVASLLDLGAGDLSFASEVVARYLPTRTTRGDELTVHAIDRLKPGSTLGGPLHAEPAVVQRLRQTPRLQFRFWGGQDMFAPDAHVALWPRYTIVSCQAPATPAFAYEPTRFSSGRLDAELRRTKGDFRPVRVDGEAALEVLHNGRSLLFPPWKFEIRGPLALLDLAARRGKACVFGAVDSQVFWEILTQLIDRPTARPADTILTPAALKDCLGPVYSELTALALGSSLILNDLTPIRTHMPRAFPGAGTPSYSFRYVEVRRGALFDGMPAGSTARLFATMKEEEPPWCLILIPET